MSIRWFKVQVILLGLFSVMLLSADATAATRSPDQHGPRTPIKHLIVVIGENHGFDNVFGTYSPPNPKQKVWNLLSLGIVNNFGLPGPHAQKAAQQRATDTDFFRLHPHKTEKFSVLPQPSTTLSALPESPCELSKFLLEFGQDPSGILF